VKKLLCLSVVVVVAAITATAAAADSGMTMSLGAPKLSSRVAISVPVTVSCSPFDPSLTLFSEGAGVSVEQASGTAIAHGFGFVNSYNFGSGFTPLFLCDNAGHTVTVNVLADTTGPPFHGGPAVFSASAGASAGLSCGPGCFYNTVNESASFGPASLTMH
jgi:hypothetical protein